MADRPINFSAPMVRALLDGRKTQTRRVLKPKGAAKVSGYDHLRLDVLDGHLWWWDGEHDGVGASQAFPYAIGDRLWVRENWQALSRGDYLPTKSQPCDLRYAATERLACLPSEVRGYQYRPSIHMPRWASRITLTVTDVRVQRLHAISEADAVAEGGDPVQARMYPELGTCRHWFQALWNSIHGPGAWDANPWVCAVTFTTHRCNIDKIAV